MLESLSHCTSNTIEKIYLFSSPVILGGRLLPVDTMLEAGQPPAKCSSSLDIQFLGREVNIITHPV